MSNYNIEDGEINSGSNLSYSSMTVYSGGTAIETTLNNNGELDVESGGTANSTTVNFGGELYVYSSGVANETTVNFGGEIVVYKGGTANKIAVDSDGILNVSSGGTATGIIAEAGAALDFVVAPDTYWQGTSAGSAFEMKDAAIAGFKVDSGNELYIARGGTATEIKENGGNVYVAAGANVTFVANTITDLQLNDAASLHSGTIAVNTVVTDFGDLYIYDKGIASNTIIDDRGGVTIYSGGTATDTTVDAKGNLYVTNGGVANNTTVKSNGKMYISSGAVLQGGNSFGGTIMLKGAASAAGAALDFAIDQRSTADSYIINDLSLITGAPVYTITVAADQAYGTYKLAQKAADLFNETVSIGSETVDFGALTINGDSLMYGGNAYSLDQIDGNLTLTISAAAPANLEGSAAGLSWEAVTGATSYVVEYSTDNFTCAAAFETGTNKVDFYALPSGTYQWRVKAEDGEFTVGEDIAVSEASDGPQKFVSDADGDVDMFFAEADGIWGRFYVAEHKELGKKVQLTGMNRISNVFEGSTDANVLMLTDDANGDAIFVDDIYTALGEQARLAQINEIRAGAGNDVIDLTSQRFEYEGGGIKVYGGLGDDTIWSGDGSNTLFGDAGNDWIIGGVDNDIIIGGSGDDTMHGGSGDDIFCFGGNWGNDTVEQFADGSVTLWFENGSESNWDAATFTYTDGANSVKVSGVDTVILKFGADVSLPVGAFAESASAKIFEDNAQGFLA